MSETKYDYDATCMRIEEGLVNSSIFAAEQGKRIEAIAINADSFICLCIGLGKTITSEPERTLYIKVKLPDGTVDSVPIYADPSAGPQIALLLGDVVLDSVVLMTVKLSS